MIGKTMARNTLFKSDAAKRNLLAAITADAVKLGASLLTGKDFTYTTHLALWEAFNVGLPNLAQWFGRMEWQRAKVPGKLFDTVNRTLSLLGGYAPGSGAVPSYSVTKRGSRENDAMYILPLAVHPTADAGRVESFELNIEHRLFAAGYDCNVRVRYKPHRLEIDKAKTLRFSLADYWQQVGQLPTNTLTCAPGITFDSGVGVKQLQLTGDRFSSFVGAASGYGKSQWSLAQLLTLALLNSPAHLSMIVCDVKADDFTALRNLPHLACPILTEAATIVATAEYLVTVMEQRKAMSERGDRSFKDKTICFFVDELADIEASLTDDERKRWVNAMQRLGQRGRSASFVIIGCSQRAYEVNAKVHKKLNLRVVGHADANDATAAANRKGVATDKLGPGSFELYGTDNGERVQGFFVADAALDDYENIVGSLVDDVANRWAGSRAHFAINGYEQPAPVSEIVIDGAALDAFELADYDTDFLIAVYDAMLAGTVSEYKINAIHKEMVGKELNATKRKEVKALVQNAVAQGITDDVTG